MVTRRLLSPAQRLSYAIGILFILLLLLGFAATIPYIWQSISLWYKTGIDRTLLQLGKVCGLFATVLLFVQIILALRLPLLDRIFGLDRLYIYHRLNGLLIVGLAFLHASLVVLPEGLDNLPIGWKFWPEMLGAALLVMLVFFVAAANFRRRIMAYHLWRMSHRPIGYLLIVMLAVHIFNVSDSFETGVPHFALWILIGVVLLIIAVTKIHQAWTTIKKKDIKSGQIVGNDVISLRFPAPPGFSYAPGQFGFLRLHGQNVSAESHPFTIASAPGNDDEKGNELQFFIRKCGDWTRSIEPNAAIQASLHAPFGLFSYESRPFPTMLVFIGGGIGVTPLLSMIRQLAAEKRSTPLMLIWSLSHKEDMFLDQELDELKKALPNLQTHIVYTREEGGVRIGREELASFLENIPTYSHFYICGPEKMMTQMRHHLLQLGFDRKSIFLEQFTL